MSNNKKILKLVLTHKWFDKIKSGEKTHEYRVVNKHWQQRIDKVFMKLPVYDGKPYYVEFQRAYAKNAEKMMFEIKSISIKNGLKTDLAIDCPVFDIELGESQ